jgi:hypothetical protein
LAHISLALSFARPPLLRRKSMFSSCIDLMGQIGIGTNSIKSYKIGMLKALKKTVQFIYEEQKKSHKYLFTIDLKRE